MIRWLVGHVFEHVFECVCKSVLEIDTIPRSLRANKLEVDPCSILKRFPLFRRSQYQASGWRASGTTTPFALEVTDFAEEDYVLSGEIFGRGKHEQGLNVVLELKLERLPTGSTVCLVVGGGVIAGACDGEA